MRTQRLQITVEGVVQGVGFRPFVHRLATRHGLGGTVCNDGEGVTLEVEGDRSATHAFVAALREEAPPLAELWAVDAKEIPARGEGEFRVLPSRVSAGVPSRILVPPDVATCAACLDELRDPDDRRHRYPFINCTDCGPRFTIIEGLPYDRPLTSMAGFELCDDCRVEYGEIRCRRYHAQPVACPLCGPRVWLADTTCDDPIVETIRRLEDGAIGAIRGLGGFHLACDAADAGAVERLRRRKGRPDQPFAVMARDIAAVERFARVDDAERELLEGWRRPIVLLDALPASRLAPSVCGTSARVGTMLPYTPLHHLILDGGRYPALVMTSGNPSDEPIICDNDEALARLADVADFFLLHDRPIVNRVDDSVVAVMPGTDRHPPSVSPVRRSRGFVPAPIQLPRGGPSVLAVGADLKNTCCLTRREQAILGPHVGDLERAAAASLLAETARRLARLFGATPELVVHDLHPDYHSTRVAEALGLPRLAVQHHHAHALACLAEHRFDGPALAITLDGTGLGTDGALWGGEVLRVEGLAWERLAHLRYLPLPGGDRAAREPWRMAVAALQEAHGQQPGPGLRTLPPFAAAEPSFVEGVLAIARTRGACPRTSSAGRLFDAVAALLGVCQRATFEGQAAMALEQLAGRVGGKMESLPWKREGAVPIQIDLLPALACIGDELQGGRSPAELARLFHVTLAGALVEVTAELARAAGLEVVALSGGTLQNRLLHGLLVAGLEGQGLRALWHRQVPPNDGGIALGQAWAGVLELSR